MFGSLKLGSVFGITIRVSWLLVPILFLLFASSGGANAAFLLMLLGSVFLHELGHSLAAQSFGIRVLDITFWPLGGMARMTEIPESPKIEATIAFAGPAVNFLLSLFALPLLAILPPTSAGGAAVMGFIWINMTLGVFNLLPAFPMDGGRLLRAALATRGDWVWATEQAVRIGRMVVIAMAVVGLFVFGKSLLLLPLIAVFVWFAGAKELVGVRLRHGRSPFNGQQMFTGGQNGNPFAAAFGSAAGAQPSAQEATWRSADGEAESTTTYESAPQPSGGARRPDILGSVEIDDDARGGFSDEVLRKLESFRGRLRRRER